MMDNQVTGSDKIDEITATIKPSPMAQQAIGDGNIQVIEGRSTLTLQQNEAFERIIGAANFANNQLKMIYDQTRAQAQQWSQFSLIAAASGFAVIVVGIFFVLADQITAGVVVSLSSVVPEATAYLFFRQSTEANNRVQEIQREQSEVRNILTTIDLIETMADVDAKDRLKEELIRKQLGLTGQLEIS
jgi:hypothetical protein